MRLTPSSLDTLFLIAHGTQPMTASAIADALTLTRGAVTQIVDALVDEGLVVRSPHPSDARSRILNLTDEAADRVRRFESQLAAALAPGFDALDDVELAQLAQLIARTAETAGAVKPLAPADVRRHPSRRG